MFKFLRDKLKNVMSAFSKKVEDEITPPGDMEETKAEPKKEATVIEKKGEMKAPITEKILPKKIKEISKPEGKKFAEPKPETEKVMKAAMETEKPAVAEKMAESVRPEKLEKLRDELVKEETKPEKRGFFDKIFGKKEEGRKGILEAITQPFSTTMLSEDKFEHLFWDLEVILLENNVAVEVIEKIKKDLKSKLVGVPLKRGNVENIIEESLQESIENLFLAAKPDVVKNIKSKKPYIMVFVGINGSGKTTSIAKVAYLLKKNGYKSVLAAGDTFRAAAIQQLEQHAEKLNVKLIKHKYGSDSAAVAFDAIKFAEAHHYDAVLVDTAGRMHSNTNLMDEMQKIMKVAKPDMKIFVGESITGNDCIEQAKRFDYAIGIDAIILSKADVDEKGGAAISVSYVTGKPIIYLGTGQKYEDLTEFEPKVLVESLGLAG